MTPPTDPQARRAQAAGAVAVIFVNTDEEIFTIGGEDGDNDVTLAVAGISAADGQYFLPPVSSSPRVPRPSLLTSQGFCGNSSVLTSHASDQVSLEYEWSDDEDIESSDEEMDDRSDRSEDGAAPAAPTDNEQLLHELKVKSQLALAAREAAQGTKAACLHARDHSVREGLEFVAHLNAARLRSADLAEATRARFERRAPRFAKL